jgi:hypothetical protein
MTPVSPKVLYSALAGIVLTAFLTNAALITPDMLTFLGPWAPFVYGTAYTALGYLVGYFKRDPLRDLGQLHADAPAPTSEPRHLA